MQRHPLNKVLVAALLVLLQAGFSQAAVVIDFTEQAGNVVSTMSGTVNLADLTKNSTTGSTGWILPSRGVVFFADGVGNLDYYSGIQTPAFAGAFGTGGYASSSTSGSYFGIDSRYGSSIAVPAGYTGDTSLWAQTTWTGTLDSLGLTPGTYTWSWGSGANADTATMTINASAVPEPSTWALGAFALACGGWQLTRRRRALRVKA